MIVDVTPLSAPHVTILSLAPGAAFFFTDDDLCIKVDDPANNKILRLATGATANVDANTLVIAAPDAFVTVSAHV